MAEGLEQAARAFQTEISPEAPRPRDESGRFSSAPARPEPMFEPRPIEGDPLTGDVRDGGEDARLAAAERRVADGRAEEGDVQSLQNRARPRDARRDDRHQPADAQPERVGEQEPSGQDAEKPDGGQSGERGEGDAEGTPEQDADSWQISVNGKPVEKLEVMVEGQPKEVTLEEAIKGYVDGETYNRRVAQVGEAVKVIEGEYQKATQFRDYYIQNLQHHEEEYAALLPREPDWDQLYAQDPRAARQLQKDFVTAQNVVLSLRQRRFQETQAREQENARRTAEYARNGFEIFKEKRRFVDNVAMNNTLTKMRRTAMEHYGFTEKEVSEVYDPRMLEVLFDASEHRSMKANVPRPIMPDKGRTLAPGSARPIGSAARRSIDDAQRKLAKTGKLDDATAVFMRLIQ
jgi:hypothetical protein